MMIASKNDLEKTQGENGVVLLENVPTAKVAFVMKLTGSAGVKVANVGTIVKATEESAQRLTATRVTVKMEKEIFKTKLA